MKITVYEDPSKFLADSRAYLEEQEVLNALILGVVQRMVDDPERFDHGPYLAIVKDAQEEIILAAMMDVPHPITISGAVDCPEEALILLADSLHKTERPLPSVHGPNPLPERFAPIWAEKVGVGYKLELGQGVYEMREVIPPAEVKGSLRMAHHSDLNLIVEWMMAFERDAFGKEIATLDQMTDSMAHRIKQEEWYLWQDGREVLSMVMSTRPTRHGITVSGVYTPPEQRGKGYASASVAAFSQKLLERGYTFTSLFTNLANPTSNKIYMNVGYRHVCDFNKYKFVG